MADAYPDLTRHDTFPKVLAYNAQHWPGETALREKQFGIWKAFTWADYNENAKRLACGLKQLGIGAGDVVALIGDNRPDWVAGEIAAHAVRAASIGLYRDVLDEEMMYLITYSEAKVVFAEDEEQVDKLLGLEEQVPTVRHIIYFDSRGMRKYEDPRLMTAERLCEIGDELLAQNPAAYDELVAATQGEETAILCTTSGTTAHPKLAMLPAGRVLMHCRAYLEADPKGPDDEYVSVLPLPWIMEQIYALGKALISRMTVNFVEEAETMMADMREIGPTFVLLAPRVWEGLAADVRARIMDATPLKQKLFDYGMKIGIEALERGESSSLAKHLLFSALKDRLEFSRLRSAATGGAALGPDTFKFFLAMGIPLRQLYGQTELLGAYTIHQSDDIDYDTVGIPFTSEIEVKIDDPDLEGVGEIVTQHPNMFLGYYKSEGTEIQDVREGWMHTGDAGFFNDKGHLTVIDRIADLAVTAQGQRFSPQFIENKLKFSPYMAEAVILGAGRDYLAAIICVRFSIVSKWAEKNRIAFTTYSDLSARPEVYELLRDEVEKVNLSLPAAQRIRKFLLLYKELDPDDGELTRTRKVRRAFIAEKYGEIIDTLYSDRKSVDIDTTIVFQDGSKQRIRTTLQVVTLSGGEKTAQAAE